MMCQITIGHTDNGQPHVKHLSICSDAYPCGLEDQTDDLLSHLGLRGTRYEPEDSNEA